MDDIRVSRFIVDELNRQGRKNKWVADKLGMTEPMFSYKVKHDSFTAKELIYISRLLDMDLNKIKKG